jgi:hypothetical protein
MSQGGSIPMSVKGQQFSGTNLTILKLGAQRSSAATHGRHDNTASGTTKSQILRD